MFDSFGPGDVRDVNESINPVFDLDERAEVRKRANLAGHTRANAIAHWQSLPRIGGDLLDAQAYSAAVRVSFEHDGFDFLPDREQLRRMFKPFRPGHLGYVHETLDTRFYFDERAVVGQADDLAAHVRVFRETLGDALPGIREELFVSERNAFLLAIKLEHLDLERVANLDDVVRRLDAAPAHIDDMQQPVYSPKVDERAVLGNILHCSFEHDAFLDIGEGIRLLQVGGFLENGFARDDDVAAFAIELDDADVDFLAEEPFKVAHRADVYL